MKLEIFNNFHEYCKAKQDLIAKLTDSDARVQYLAIVCYFRLKK
jgi:hypothetical protein